MNIFKTVLIFSALALLGACQSSVTTQKPDPALLSEDDIGFYDQMIVVGHAGPKAQIHLAGSTSPLWFSSVRDGLAYLKSPEQSAQILAIYVNDIGVAQNWLNMRIGNWIEAETAFFVVGSNAKGGMGAPEFVPFSSEDKAREFSIKRGGKILQFSEITADMVLAPVEQEQMAMPSMDGNSAGTNMNDMDMKPEGG
ncbi:MAG: nitrous oxide reductase accessory protein NosL [Devosiaceae bacterium]|nr:nitrous oxide reductase accessory protein NosL [Devosiaceae bacterium]